MKIPRVLVAVFTQATNIGGSSVTIDLTKYLEAELCYLVADVVEPASAVFTGVRPHPDVIVNPLRGKPHMRVGHTTWTHFWDRNRDVYRDWWWLLRQQRQIARWRPDVVCSMTTLMHRADIFFVHLLRAQSYLESYGYASTMSEKVMQRLDLKERQMLAVERQNMRSENHHFVMVSSLATKNALQTHYGIPDERIVLIRNAIDVDRFHMPSERDRVLARTKLGIRPDQPVVLFVGRSPERKGVDYLIDAIDAAPPGTVLLLAGFDRNSYVERLVRHSRSDVRLVGEVTTEELISTYFPVADLFALPSRVEPYGGVILEAMACGVPPVVTPQCGAAEIIATGETGFVLQGDNVSRELSELFHQALNQRNSLRIMGDAARRAMELAPSWKAQSERLAELVDRIRHDGLYRHG